MKIKEHFKIHAPMALAKGFNPKIGTQVRLSKEGRCASNGRPINAVYKSRALTGIEDDGTEFRFAFTTGYIPGFSEKPFRVKEEFD